MLDWGDNILLHTNIESGASWQRDANSFFAVHQKNNRLQVLYFIKNKKVRNESVKKIYIRDQNVIIKAPLKLPESQIVQNRCKNMTSQVFQMKKKKRERAQPSVSTVTC